MVYIDTLSWNAGCSGSASGSGRCFIHVCQTSNMARCIIFIPTVCTKKQASSSQQINFWLVLKEEDRLGPPRTRNRLLRLINPICDCREANI